MKRQGGIGLLLAALIGMTLPAGAAEDELTALQAAFLRGQYRQVLDKATVLLDRGGGNKDDLLYLRGISALKLGDMETARASLNRLLAEYPSSKWAGETRQALRQAQEESYYTVQVGAFSSKGNASRLARALERRGHEAEVLSSPAQGKLYHRVRVGRFQSRGEAEKQAAELERDGFPCKVLP